jgi:hypothetical protein
MQQPVAPLCVDLHRFDLLFDYFNKRMEEFRIGIAEMKNRNQ